MGCLGTRAREGFSECQEGIQARLPDRAICPPQLLAMGRSASHGRPDAPPLPGPGHLGDLEARQPGGGLSPMDTEQVALQFSTELDFLTVDGGSPGLTSSPRPGEHSRARGWG